MRKKEQHGIDFDSVGNVYVVDTANSRVQVFTPEGKFIKKWGTLGSKNNEFLMPQDIAIDSNDNIYVSDVGDAHPEISFIGNYLIKNWRSTQSNCAHP